METQKVGIRECREKLASYLLESDMPLAITQRGELKSEIMPRAEERCEPKKLKMS